MADPVPLSRDFLRHEPASVRIGASVGNRYARYRLTSRYVRIDGMILEVTPPTEETNLFRVGESLEFRLKLPHRDQAVFVNGTLNKLIPLASDPDGNLSTVIGVRFGEINADVRLVLEAHELAVAAQSGIERSPRIPVRFPVELSGIDVMSPLVARDLSMTGMFVGGRARFSAGKLLAIRFKLPFQEREVSLQGKVVWAGEKKVTGLPEPCAGFGVQFVAVPPPSRVAIATYYARNTVVP